VKERQAQDELVDEEILAYIRKIEESKNCWPVQYTCLFLKSTVEFRRSHTFQRSLLQLEVCVCEREREEKEREKERKRKKERERERKLFNILFLFLSEIERKK